MSGGGDGGVGDARRREQERERKIQVGMSDIDNVFSGFNDGFYNQLRKAQLDWSTPQIRDQYDDAKEQLTYALARGGQLNSTVAATKQAQLAKSNQLALSRADSIADSAVKQARSDVERERTDLVSILQATADPANAANAAHLRADQLRIGQPMADIGLVFQNATAGLAGALAPRYDEYGVRTGGGPRFGGQRDSSKVIGP